MSTRVRTVKSVVSFLLGAVDEDPDSGDEDEGRVNLHACVVRMVRRFSPRWWEVLMCAFCSRDA